MGLQGQSWFLDIARTFCAAIDSVIFRLIREILYGIFNLANLTATSNVLGNIYSRIYVILGIFMAFKLSFSFFQYIIDPDSMGPKSDKGVSKLLFRVGTMLAALLLLPNLLFGSEGSEGLLTRAQNAFLPTLPKILLGVNNVSGAMSATGGGTATIDDTIENASETMTSSLIQGFFTPSKELDDVCGEGTYDNIPAITSIDEFVKNVNLTCDAKGTGVLGIGAKKYYKYSYLCLISTIVAVLFVVMLLGIAIDIAKRVFKMIILEVIAPIPIMSLIDPKSSKDGPFSKWLKNLISTFLDIFLKLGLIYIILVFIQLIVNNQLFTNVPAFDNPIRSAFMYIFLILALIFFAREAPMFIRESLGMKGEKGLGTGLGAAAGFLGGAIGGRSLGAALTGAATGAMQGGDPKGHAYQAARDQAGQIRTGNDKWKGGLANNLGRITARNQFSHSTGINADTLAAGKAQMKDLQQRSAVAQSLKDLVSNQSIDVPTGRDKITDYIRNNGKFMQNLYRVNHAGQVEAYDSQSHSWGVRNLDSKADLIEFMDDVSTTIETSAGKAKSDYEDASKAASAYGIVPTSVEKWGMSNGRRERYNARHANRLFDVRRDSERAHETGRHYDPLKNSRTLGLDETDIHQNHMSNY